MRINYLAIIFMYSCSMSYDDTKYLIGAFLICLCLKIWSEMIYYALWWICGYFINEYHLIQQFSIWFFDNKLVQILWIEYVVHFILLTRLASVFSQVCQQYDDVIMRLYDKTQQLNRLQYQPLQTSFILSIILRFHLIMNIRFLYHE